MKFMQVKVEGQNQVCLIVDDGAILLNDIIPDAPQTIQELISGDDKNDVMDKIALSLLGKNIDHIASIDEFDINRPILNPGKIICIGLNYSAHAIESKAEIPDYPVVFSKFNNTLADPNEVVTIPNETEQFDYEAELVVVIGKKAKDVNEDDALSYVAGYTIGNDLSARDLQFRTNQWLLGKTGDQMAPTGPFFVTEDDFDHQNAAISLTVNGKEMQASNTAKMLFPVPTIIAYLSKYMTLEPGDLIFSGTPEGVALGFPDGQKPWLQSGDVIETSIEGIGTLTTKIG